MLCVLRLTVGLVLMTQLFLLAVGDYSTFLLSTFGVALAVIALLYFNGHKEKLQRVKRHPRT